jgi:hypothetical protein
MIPLRAGIVQLIRRQGYKLDDQGISVKFPEGIKDISLYSSQISSGAHPAFYSRHAGASHPGGKASRA